MQRLLHVVLVLSLLLGVTSFQASATAQIDDILDLANVPVPVQNLPETGYQVLTGGYLSPADTANLLANPRNLDEQYVMQWFADVGLSRTYVLDLVLPEDRGWQNSPFLAITQTSVFLLEDESGADAFQELLQNYANTVFVTEISPAVGGAYTITMVGEAGDQIRTLVRDGRVVLEIVSLDVTGLPDETEHILIVEATLNRLTQLRDFGSGGLSSQALTLMPGENTANFAHSQQTGVHGIYRYRDAGIQPAIGELDTDIDSPPAGITSLFVGGGVARAGSGYGLVSVWLASFDSESVASSFFEYLMSGAPGVVLVDPFFSIPADESWLEQGVLGVYRVTGTYNGQDYSGNVEIRQVDNKIVAVGYRSVGAALPGTNLTSNMMDHQLACLEAQIVCPPFELVIDTAPPQATPVAENPGLSSVEFGWSLPDLGPDWQVDEIFTDAGYDRIGLRNGLSIFELESVINHHGEPVQCVLDELHLLEELEEHSVITLWQDANGNTNGGNSPGQAWVVYRVEPLADERADQEYVVRIDCFSLQPGSANLVAKHYAPVDYWIEEEPKGDFLRGAIVLPELSTIHGKLAISAHDWRTTMIYFHSSHLAA